MVGFNKLYKLEFIVVRFEYKVLKFEYTVLGS